MRLPNGYGNVSKLSGKRRKPYRARKTVGWDFDTATGKATQKYITIGYYETRQLALQALADYNKNPYDLDAANITFAEVYERWSAKKFGKIANRSVSRYRNLFNICKSIHNERFSELKLHHLQYVADNSGKCAPTLKILKSLFSQLFDYAVANEIISKDKHIVEHLEIPAEEKSNKHYRFSEAEVDTLWKHSNDEQIQFILMLIYSGVRPGELINIELSNVNLEEECFFVRKGKNKNAVRKVPIHNKTLPFFEHWVSKGGKYLLALSNDYASTYSRYVVFANRRFPKLLENLGILYYTKENGETANHLLDDTRHTFTTMWKEKKLDEAMRRKIQGHSGKGIGEEVYTHFDFDVLKEELNKL